MEFLQFISQDATHFLGFLIVLSIAGKTLIRLVEAWRGVRYYDCNCKCGE